ncbi:MAG: PKD domain-containing protein [Pirellulales bacterium]
MSTAYGMSQVGVFIRDNNNTIRGNVISGSSTVAACLEDTTTGTIVVGNLIGTDATGTLARPNLIGVSVGTSGNTIGGPTVADRNVISGNADYGLRFEFGSTNNTVQGNLVGVQSDGTTSLPNTNGAIFVSSNATLKGTGSFTGNVLNQGTVAPGNSPGIVTINGNYTQSSGASLQIELQGTNPTVPDFDQLFVNGAVSLAGTLDVSLLGGFNPSVGNSFKIIDNDGSDAITGTFTGLPEGATVSGGGATFQISYVGGTGNDVVLTTTSAVPFVVTNNNDSGAGSLRQAVLNANNHPGADTITFDNSFLSAQTIALNSLLTVNDATGSTTITGPGANLLTINAAASATGFDIFTASSISGIKFANASQFAVFVHSGNSTISTSTFANNVTGLVVFGVVSSDTNVFQGNATGLNNHASVTVTSNTFTSNVLGMYTEGTATITGSTFTGNTATALSTPGNTTITGSSFTNNSGSQAGAILSAKPTFSTSTLTISSSTFTGNSSTTYGGAIYNDRNILVLNNTTITGNTATLGGAGVANTGTATLSSTTIDNNTLADLTTPSDFYGRPAESGSSNNTIGLGGTAGLTNGVNGNVVAYSANPLLVTNNNDSGPGSLRNAIDYANSNPGADTITFDSSFSSSKTITLGPSPLYMKDASGLTTISGPGATLLTINAANATRAIEIMAGDTSISGITVANTPSSGFGILVTAGFATISDSKFTNNGNASVRFLSNGSSINNQFVGNGIGIDSHANITVTGNTFSNNAFSLYSEGNLTVADSTFTGSSIIAIQNFGSAVISGSTFYGNNVTASGVIYTANSGGLKIINSTMFDNSSSGSGGAIYVQSGPVTITNSTIVGNRAASGGGIYNENGTVTLNNSIVGGNTLLNLTTPNDIAGSNVSGVYVSPSSSHNLLGTGGSGGLTNGVNGNIVVASNSALGVAASLANNGGPTLTLALLATSPAIDAGLNALALDAAGAALAFDQRSASRIQFASVDIGAYEGVNLLYVTNTNDSGVGSLRDAITFANNKAGSDTIRFQIPGSGVQTIAPTSALPTITDSVVIDGTSQSGYSGSPIIELNGTSAGAGVNGLTITGANSTVKGLVINRFAGNGILITGASATGNTISGNYIGLSASGTTRLANSLNGILIQSGANHNLIGTNGDGVNDSSERNVISGNASGINANINIIDSGTEYNRVAGNYVGLTADGTSTVANPGRGIRIAVNAANNIVGTDGSNDAFNASERNVVSGISGITIFVVQGSGNVVAGNWVGLNSAGTVALGNSLEGISLSGGTNARVGTNGDGIADADERNVVVGSATFGVIVADNNTNSVVAGNYIGVDPSGTIAMPNSSVGGAGFHTGMVITIGANNLTVGGTLPAQRNVISGNTGSGIIIAKYSTFAAPQNITVLGNYIGTDASGVVALPNTSDGIRIENSPNNTIGGTIAGSRNTISGNSSAGVTITGSLSTGNVLLGNYIGTTADGTAALGNRYSGVSVAGGAINTTIGGETISARNVISGSYDTGAGYNGFGVDIGVANNTMVRGNYIGTDAGGGTVLSNVHGGIIVFGAATNTDIGGTTQGRRNIIVGSTQAFGTDGIALYGDNSGTRVRGNFIGTNSTGTAKLGSLTTGVAVYRTFSGISDFPTDVEIGGTSDWSGGILTGAGNLIAGSSQVAVGVDSGISSVAIRGNFLGTNVTGTAALGNDIGIRNNGTGTIIGGSGPGQGNVISGNRQGVFLDQFSSATVLQGNRIGTNAQGTSALATQDTGVLVFGSNHTLGAGAGNLISGNSSYGIVISGSGVSGVTVTGNFIGTNQSGTSAIPNGTGIQIMAGAHDNTIGGVTTGSRNLVSGNSGAGVRLDGSIGGGVSGNLIKGNYIGTNASGTAAIPNNIGIDEFVSTNTIIGGTGASEGNVISGNTTYGVRLNSTQGTLRLYGNLIGTDASGMNDLGNGSDGVYLAFNVADQTIGGDQPGMGNVISGNDGYGIGMGVFGGSENRIEGNLIGTNKSGNASVGNLSGGVLFVDQGGSSKNYLGGHTAILGRGKGNVISGNYQFGVNAGTNSVIQGNIIGLDIAGNFAIGNAAGGITTYGNGKDVQIGGTTDSVRNIISGNRQTEVRMYGAGHWTIQGNFIGTDITGTRALAQANTDGLYLDNGFSSATGSNLIGGSVQGAANVISGYVNGTAIYIGQGQSNNVIAGNKIGTDVTGTLPLGNNTAIWLNGYAGSSRDVSNTRIGTDGDGINDYLERNIISGNLMGVFILGAATDQRVKDTTIAGNYFGVAADGLTPLPNQSYGVYVRELSENTIVGGSTPAKANVIGNSAYGIYLGDASNSTTVAGNYIGVGKDGVTHAPNSIGVYVSPTAHGNVIGGAGPADGNIFANNVTAGLRLDGTSGKNGTYLNNTFFDNIGLAIDAGTLGPTPNGTDSNVLDAPVLTSATINGNSLEIEGIVDAGRTVAIYASSPTLSGFGTGKQLLGTFTEGSGDDSLSGTQSYGPTLRGVNIGSGTANKFRFTLPLPSGVQFGSLLTAVAAGSTSEFSSFITVGDVVSNLAPQITVSSSGIFANAGSEVALSGSFYDPDSTQWVASVDYGDGSGVQPLALGSDRTFQLNHTYNSPGSFQITVRVTDNSSTSSIKTINVAVQNEAPTATFNLFSITSPADEGQLVQLKGQFEDTSGSYSATIDWGDGTTSTVNQVFSPTGQIVSLGNNKYEIRSTHVYRDDANAAVTATASDVYRVQITVSDGAGIDVTPSGLFLEEVRNVLPSNLLVDLSSSSVNEGQLVSLSGSFIDPGLDDIHRVVIDWADGTQSTINLAAINSPVRTFVGIPSLQHVYANDPAEGPDQYVITVSVTDDDQPESPTVVTRTLTVNNVVPFGLLLSSSSATIFENDMITLSGSFIDPGLLDSHDVSIDWGDGSSRTQLSLDQGIGNFSGLQHRYEDNSVSGAYIITVRVSDKDSPGEVIATLPITVQNAIPQLASVSSSATASMTEGQELTVTGSYSDASRSDSHNVIVSWGDGSTSSATVDQVSRTFTATHRYLDNGTIAVLPIGPGPHQTGQFIAEILVTISDDDGASSSSSTLQRVDNVAPELLIGPSVNNNDPNLIQLVAQTSDAGQNDTINVSWQAYPAGFPSELQTGVGPNFTVDRSSRPTLVWLVRAVATDDDGGFTVFETALLVGSNASDNIVIDNATFSTAGVDKLLVLGLGGDDTIDGTHVTTAGNQLILDGGDGVDNLFGGAGDDIYYLWRGNDNANVQQYDVNNLPVGPTPIELGNDNYKLKPNSVLTVVDRSGDNTLDFSLANYGDNSGISFDLSVANSATLVQQDVSITQPAAHFVNTLGSFSGLVGSSFGDRLTAASNSTVDGGAGSDSLTVKSGTVGATLSGGADDDTLTVTGTGIANLNFGGDDGIDSLINSGSIAGLTFRGGSDDDIVTNSGAIVGLLNFGGDDGIDTLLNTGTIADLKFSGGADDDVLQNRGTISGALNFGGDDGIDAFLNAGSIANLTFRGGADDDVFINNGATPTTISFIGDDDILLSGVGTIDALNFGGDDGMDTFVNLSTITTMTFHGGSDDDLFINNGSTPTTLNFGGDNDDLVGVGSIGTLNFFGDTGSDEPRNLGLIADLSFRGGADDDLLTNTGTVTAGLNFGGDDGIDGLFNTGNVGSLTFNGGADDDILINNGPVATTLTFGGDDDLLVGTGVIGEINFSGDDGADLLVNLGAATTINFGGGADDDRLVNAGSVSTTLSFGGDDEILVAGAAVVTSLNFGGDDGADSMLNTGTISNLTFGGGADDDVIVNRGSITGTLDFGGDDDIVIGTSGVSLIHFGGDEGADTLINLASLNNVNFTGGADDDVVRNEGQILGSLNFGGDDGIDSIINTGSLTSVIFDGGADDDLIVNTGSITAGLNFGGDDGADVVQNTGTISSLTFGGGADDDVIVNKGTIIGELNFGGDDDILVGTSGVSLIHFGGDEGSDRLINVSSIGAVVFTGGADDDRLENTGTIMGSLNFLGDDGLDTLVNRGPVGSINFTGGADDDLLFNSATVASIVFTGGGDDDVLANSGSGIAVLNFTGDDGADVMINSGSQIASLSFTGGGDDDVLVSSGKGLGSISFTGDNGVPVVGHTSRDTLIVRGSGDGSTASSILFQGGYDDDAFENNATGFTTITFVGGADDDAMLNNASGLSTLNFSGDDGKDVIVNHGAAIGNLTFTGGADDDILDNDGDLLVNLTFNGGADDDLMINSGHQIASLSFNGGSDDDILSNSGNSIVNLSFQGGGDDDLLVNDGAFISVLSFGGILACKLVKRPATIDCGIARRPLVLDRLCLQVTMALMCWSTMQPKLARSTLAVTMARMHCKTMARCRLWFLAVEPMMTS